MIECVAEILGLPTEAVTGDVVIGNRRSLLSTVSMLYTVRIFSETSSSTIIRQLQQAMSSDTFLFMLSSKSSLSITSLTSVSITDATPTSAPTDIPGILANVQGIRSTLTIDKYYRPCLKTESNCDTSNFDRIAFLEIQCLHRLCRRWHHRSLYSCPCSYHYLLLRVLETRQTFSDSFETWSGGL